MAEQRVRETGVNDEGPLRAQRRDDEHGVERHAWVMGLSGREKIDCVFIGDSLVRRWQDNPLLWERFFSDFAPANFGVGGDTLENLLWRIEDGELEGMNPRLAVLLIGTNNLQNSTDAHIREGILQICRSIRLRLPESRLLLLGLLPRKQDERGAASLDRIRSINRVLAAAADNEGYCFFDAGPLLAEPDTGLVSPDLMPDGLHLNAQGYEKFGPLLAERMELCLQEATGA